MLWGELTHLLEIGPQTANHKKLLMFIRNENVGEGKETNKLKRLAAQTTNSPMSPPGPTEANKRKTLASLNSQSNRYICFK